MARKRPEASNVTPPLLTCLDGGLTRSDPPPLTRAEAQALRRSAPITHEQLQRHLNGVGRPPLRGA